MQKLMGQYCLNIIVLLIFLKEYFPAQQNQPEHPVVPPTNLNDVKFNVNDLYKPQVDRIVFIVIDALRLDFVTRENFPFLVSAVQESGCMSSVHVHSPTVTLPRIKAITTGRVPQFLDIVYNLASTGVIQDSVLHRAKDIGKKLVFYGDDTWLKLYPNVFERFEGVSSFFVNDFTQVDNNVTRNVEKELSMSDWDLMFLHYLGLDHIGHVYGPFSHLVEKKLLEMDDIIKKIYKKLQTQNGRTVVIITSDHGMKDSGGHGGTTSGETEVPFLLIGKMCQNDSIIQTDISAILTVLMGLTFPVGNTGRVNLNILGNLPLKQMLYVLNYASLSLKALTTSYGGVFTDASNMYYRFLHTHDEKFALNAKILYERYLHRASKKLTQTYLNQNDEILFLCILTMINFLLISLYNCFNSKWAPKNMDSIIVIGVLVFQLLFRGIELITLLATIILCGFIFRYLFLIYKHLQWRNLNINVLMNFCTILYIISLQSSSFIEEEHQLWYFFVGTCIVILSYYERNWFKLFQVMSLFAALRVLRTLNPAGNKWSHLHTLSKSLLLEEHYIYFQILVCASFVLLCITFNSLMKRNHALSYVTVILVYVLNTWIKSDPLLGKIVWIFIILNLISGLHLNKHLDNVIIAWLLICSALMRPHNLILLPLCVYTCLTLKHYVKNNIMLAGLYVWLGRTFFFLQGHSNSLASVDIAAGYVGLKTYIPFFVISQTLCHTYAFPILTTLLMLKECSPYNSFIWEVSIIHRLIPLIFTCIIVFIQRYHLFVWSVFAPKLLIESCHSMILFLELLAFFLIRLINMTVCSYCFPK
ncbi:hypothetical protein FQA39_LY07026 [Lamprigera yunnana]|nr:hypothetical protein FQA39_LY07026 [Lamprigera yunnana]